MLRELHADNKAFVESLRAVHVITSKANDYATTGPIEIWIDEAERRAGLLFDATSKGMPFNLTNTPRGARRTLWGAIPLLNRSHLSL